MSVNKEDTLRQFCDVTGADENRSRFFLESSNWQLEVALSSFYEHGGNVEDLPAAANVPPMSDSDMDSPPRSPSRPPKKDKKKTNSQFATLDSLQQESSSEDEEGQAFYAGGSERSGQQILGPPGKGRQDIVTEMFKSVRERGAVFEDGPATTSRGRGGAFSGVGYRLGQTADDHEQVTPGKTQQDNQPRSVRLQLYREGFTVDSGPLRQYADPSNAEFLSCIRRGEIPSELSAGGAEVRLSLEDRRHDDTPRSGRSLPSRAFTGKGHMLGSPTPATVGATAAVAATGDDRAANTRAAQTAVRLDDALPATTVQFRLADGTRLTGRFNHSHTVGDLIQYVTRAEPAYQLQAFALLTTFPSTELCDHSQTLKDANLLNTTLLQRLNVSGKKKEKGNTMSGDTLYEAPKRYNVSKMRVHDYLYDSAFIVSGARDYARTAFKAAMASAQMVIQPVYKTMFSELRQFPRMQVVYHPNCRLPSHVDRSYAAYLHKVQQIQNVTVPELGGKDRFKYCATPKKLLPIKSTSPDFNPPTPYITPGPTRPRNRGTQSLYRESSAQTIPWQPDAKPADKCETTPEVLHLDKLEWGPGSPYRLGDLPADFHTTEIINKMRHARKWSELVEKGTYPKGMKKRDAIITDIETKDWIFREAEIDELQSIRQVLLQKMQSEQSQKTNTRTSTKLANLWTNKKTDMEKKIENIRRTRDRELRKLSSLREVSSGGAAEAGRAARGAGCVTRAAVDPASDAHAPRRRHGYQASRRHAEIYYDASLLVLEDHTHLADPPPWLQECGQNLTKTCSGKHLPRDKTQLCERETKWSEQFLRNLHDDLKKARIGAASSAGPLRVLKPRNVPSTPRPSTPEVEAVPDDEEAAHQSALMMQRLVKGRAVQNLMFEGRTRSAELTEELKTTHGLQNEDRARIAKEAARARDFIAVKTENEQKEEAISALVEELCGGAVSSALDFLEKELRRLKEERRQHAYILIAIREKTMREAAEAGRRQKEEHRRREHDEMFKQVLGVTQGTVDAYLRDVTREGSQLAAELTAVQNAVERADDVDAAAERDVSTAEQHELVAELVHQFLLPSSHRAASRLRVRELQTAGLQAAREAMFGVIDDGVVVEEKCKECGNTIEKCKCPVCPVRITPIATSSRDDPRWKLARRRDQVEKTLEDRYPLSHEMRNLANCIVDDAVAISRYDRKEEEVITRFIARELREKVELTIDAGEVLEELISRATGEIDPTKRPQYRHYMRRIYEDALERSDYFYKEPSVPSLLPSELRRLQEEEEAKKDPYCHCEAKDSKIVFKLDTMTPAEKSNLLPSELRILEDFRRCKCDTVPSLSPVNVVSPLEEEMESETESDVTDEEYGE